MIIDRYFSSNQFNLHFMVWPKLRKYPQAVLDFSAVCINELTGRVGSVASRRTLVTSISSWLLYVSSHIKCQMIFFLFNFLPIWLKSKRFFKFFLCGYFFLAPISVLSLLLWMQLWKVSKKFEVWNLCSVKASQYIWEIMFLKRSWAHFWTFLHNEMKV